MKRPLKDDERMLRTVGDTEVTSLIFLLRHSMLCGSESTFKLITSITSLVTFLIVQKWNVTQSETCGCGPASNCRTGGLETDGGFNLRSKREKLLSHKRSRQTGNRNNPEAQVQLGGNQTPGWDVTPPPPRRLEMVSMKRRIHKPSPEATNSRNNTSCW